jgi:hypothetical protein
MLAQGAEWSNAIEREILKRNLKRNQAEQVSRSWRASHTGDREKIPGLVPTGMRKIYGILLLFLDGKGLNKTMGLAKRGVSLALGCQRGIAHRNDLIVRR